MGLVFFVSLLSLYLFAHRISPDTDPRSAFYIGQVMICYVLSCQPDQAKLRLSFKVQHININLIFLAFKRQLHLSRLTGFTLLPSCTSLFVKLLTNWLTFFPKLVHVLEWESIGSLSSHVFERRTSAGSGLIALLSRGFEYVFGQIFPLRIRTLDDTNLVA